MSQKVQSNSFPQDSLAHAESRSEEVDESATEFNANFDRTLEGEFPSPRIVAQYPKAWYMFGTTGELSKGPATKEIMGQKLVAFQTESGAVGVMHNRCSHMGSNLGNGCVVGETIECPFHGWRYGVDGNCEHIPAVDDVPAIAKQMAYPTEVRFGNIYFFNAPEPMYPLPFFVGVDPDDLVAARPFEFRVKAPWYMIGSNGIDEQHFLCGHDRQIIGKPEVEFPHPWLHRSKTTFHVVGKTNKDRLTRMFGGGTVTLNVDDWSSTYILTRSTLKNTESFGILSTIPVGPRETVVNVTACGWKSRSRIKRALWDPVSARMRRYFIREFLRPDVPLLEETGYSPNSLLDIDQSFLEYVQWLASLPR